MTTNKTKGITWQSCRRTEKPAWDRKTAGKSKPKRCVQGRGSRFLFAPYAFVLHPSSSSSRGSRSHLSSGDQSGRLWRDLTDCFWPFLDGRSNNWSGSTRLRISALMVLLMVLVLCEIEGRRFLEADHTHVSLSPPLPGGRSLLSASLDLLGVSSCRHAS